MASIVLSDGEHVAGWTALDPDWSAVRFSVAANDGLAVTILCHEERRMAPTVGGLAMLFKGVEHHRGNMAYVMETIQKIMGAVMPETLEEAASLVLEWMTPDETAWAKETPLTMAIGIIRGDGFGARMRGKWELHSDSPLKKAVQTEWKLFGHENDLAGLIFAAVWARVRGADVQAALAEEVESYRVHWRKQGVSPETGERSIIVP